MDTYIPLGRRGKSVPSILALTSVAAIMISVVIMCRPSRMVWLRRSVLPHTCSAWFSFGYCQMLKMESHLLTPSELLFHLCCLSSILVDPSYLGTRGLHFFRTTYTCSEMIWLTNSSDPRSSGSGPFHFFPCPDPHVHSPQLMTICLTRVRKCNVLGNGALRSIKHFQPSQNVAPPSPQWHDHDLGAWQSVCTYNSCHVPATMWSSFEVCSIGFPRKSLRKLAGKIASCCCHLPREHLFTSGGSWKNCLPRGAELLQQSAEMELKSLRFHLFLSPTEGVSFCAWREDEILQQAALSASLQRQGELKSKQSRERLRGRVMSMDLLRQVQRGRLGGLA